MNKVKVELENCFGIKNLKHEFDFSTHKVVAIYAPNGSMKSSFAKTFSAYKTDAPSGDQYRPGKPWSRKFTDENDVPINKECVFVVAPYDGEYESSEDIASLLINKKLKKEYTKISKEREDAKKAFLKSLKELSGSSKDLEKEISLAITPKDDQFFDALGRIKDKVIKQTEALFSDVVYDEIFNDEVAQFLSSEEVRKDIKSYIETYNQLLEKSTYFKRGIFNFYNAKTIAEALEKHGFFKATHTVSLKDKKIENKAQLEEVIESEKKKILADPTLRSKWDDIDVKIQRLVGLRKFYDYITKNETLLVHLGNLREFKENIWVSYFTTKKESYIGLLELHAKTEKEIEKIQTAAAKENSLWEEVIRIYNDRFLYLPFRVDVLNKAQVATGQDKNLKVGFTFTEGGDEVSVKDSELKDRLSTGERKAFYILYLIFDVQTRRQSGDKTLFIVDDIADSFDYKNKYAIIEYLKDMSAVPHFRQIILTHNFDFFRTITSRNVVHYSQILMTTRTADGIKLLQAAGVKDVFAKDWKREFFTNPKKRVACIPFMRNLVEYRDGDDDAKYQTLTALLHWMDRSSTITEEELGEIFVDTFRGESALKGNKGLVLDLIQNEAAQCVGIDEGVNFENKIVIAIATRIAAEKFMVEKINDPAAIAGIGKSRTPKLLKFYKDKFNESEITRVLDRVVLMTPENIHLNSFMYEPILDMSDSHLKKLYGEVLALK